MVTRIRDPPRDAPASESSQNPQSTFEHPSGQEGGISWISGTARHTGRCTRSPAAPPIRIAIVAGTLGNTGLGFDFREGGEDQTIQPIVESAPVRPCPKSYRLAAIAS